MAKKNRYNLIQYNRAAVDYTPPEPFSASYGILTVIGKDGEPIPVNGYRDFCIVHKQDGWDRLKFTIPVDLDVYQQIAEETAVRYADIEYLVKKINNGNIECEINLDFLKRIYYENYTATKATLNSLLTSILPSGWTAPGAISVKGTADIALDYCTGADILAELQTQFRVWFVWNHANKTCAVVSAETAEDRGKYVTDELNLKNLSYRGNTANFCTRLYCYGKSGASIDSVNSGKRYIEDYTYSTKLVVGYFKCDYEQPENILTAGRYELTKRSRPEQSYECDVVDLAKLSPDYAFLDFALHNSVTLIDRKRGLKVKHRIVEYREYPDEPERNVVTLAQAVRSMARIKEVVKSAVDEVRLEVAEVNAAVAENVTAIQANINDINANVASVNANVGTVVNDIATLNTKTASLSSRQDRTETAQASLTQTVASQGATINGVVTWQATNYVNDRQETANALAAINLTATSQGASISLLTTWKDTTYVNDRKQTNEALAAINQTASSQGASIEALTTWKSTTYASDRQETTEALAKINQTVSNQGASITSLTTWKNETYACDKRTTTEALAAINQTVSNQGASISTLTTWKNETYVSDRKQITDSLAAINQTASSQGASINALVSWKETTYVNDRKQTNQSIASAYAAANEAGAMAGLVVEKTTNGNKVKASVIISAINNESTAAIAADRINFTGFTTFVRPSDLQGGGSVTTINGGLITTETIDVGSIKKSTMTNGTRAVAFDAGIQTSYVRTNDITATGQLNLGATLVAVGAALKVNGKNVLVEGDVDLTGYATQTWSNNAFAVKDHVHSGYLNTTSANADTLVVKKVGSTDSYNIALVGHGHSNYALANHTHDFTTTDHMKFKSTSGANITLTRLGATTNTDYNFSLANHTHTGYISSSDLSGYLEYNSTSGSTLILTSGTTTKINVALANHTHDTDIVDHMLFGSTSGTNITLKRIGAYSNTNYTFALANHTHAGAEVNYTDLLKYKSTTGANITLTKIGAYSNTDYTFSLANHTHSGMEVNYANLLQVVNKNDATGVVNAKYVTYSAYGTSSTTTLSLALWSSNSGGGGSTVDFMKFNSTTGANITLTKIGSYSNTNYTFSLANHTHSSYVSTGDLNGKWYVNINGTKYYLRSP